MQVIGLCRFSYPALGGFQRTHETIEDRANYLYHPDRLNHRFRLFESLCLPSMALQSDCDFQFLILIGQDLPDWAKTRLENATNSFPHIKIIAEPPQKHRDVASKVINDHRRWGQSACIQFRLDDDDAVRLDYVKHLKTAADVRMDELPNELRLAIDYTSGYAVTLGPTGISATKVLRKNWTPALAAIFRKGSNKTIMNFGHHKIDRFMPTQYINDPAMFVRSFHGENDSTAASERVGLNFQPISDQDANYLRDNFGVDEDHVKSLWSDV